MPATITDTALRTIAEQGLLGAICILLIAALSWAMRGWLKEKDDRLADQKAMGAARQKDNEALKNLTVELKEHSAQLVLDSTRSQGDMASSLTRQEGALEELQGAITNLQEQTKSNNNFLQRQEDLLDHLRQDQQRVGTINERQEETLAELRQTVNELHQEQIRLTTTVDSLRR